MINNSTKTLLEVKTELASRLQDTRISDTDIIYAINDFYSIVQRLDRNHAPEKYQNTSGAISIDSNGYDLTNLSNIGTLHTLRVWRNKQNTANIVPKRFKGSVQLGYYVEGNTLFLTPEIESTQTIYIQYQTKTSRVAVGSVLGDHTLLIDQDLEMALRLYLESSFFDGQYQFDLRNDAEGRAMGELQRYFDDNTGSRGW